MKLSWLKAPSSRLWPTSSQQAGSLRAGLGASPLSGGKDRHGAAGNGSFNHQNCAIWNDIQRALDGSSK